MFPLVRGAAAYQSKLQSTTQTHASLQSGGAASEVFHLLDEGAEWQNNGRNTTTQSRHYTPKQQQFLLKYHRAGGICKSGLSSVTLPRE